MCMHSYMSYCDDVNACACTRTQVTAMTSPHVLVPIHELVVVVHVVIVTVVVGILPSYCLSFRSYLLIVCHGILIFVFSVMKVLPIYCCNYIRVDLIVQ